MDQNQHTERSIGLWGAIMTLVGLVIGASIYILPGQLAATAGPGVIVAYSIGGVMAFLTCLIAAQIGCIISRSGGGYRAVSDILSPMAGFLVMWGTILAVVLACALVSLGFVDYLHTYFPNVPFMPTAIGLVLVFGLLNLIGTQASVFSQMVMTTIFLIATGIFIVAGLSSAKGDNLVPLMPTGMEGVLAIIVPAYFSWTGVAMLMEIGGEIKNPSRNIPTALLIGFGIIMVFYLGVCIAVVGNVPWESLTGDSAPVSTAAKLLLPEWLVKAITLSALLAAATSLNSLLLAYPRDIYAVARRGLFPSFLGELSGKHHIPRNAVATLTAVIIIALLSGGKIVQFATIATLAFMLFQIFLAMVVVRLPSKMPEAYQNAAFKLPLPIIWISGVVVMVSSAAFMIISAVGDPGITLLFVVFMIFGAVYYHFRKHNVTADEHD